MPAPDPRRPPYAPVAALAAGLLLLALGVLAARSVVPAWQAGELPPPERFVESYRSLARTAGVELVGHDVRWKLSRGFERGPANPYQILGPAARDWLIAEHRELFVDLSSTATSAEGLPIFFITQLDLAGRPWNVSITRSDLQAMFTPQWEVPLPTPEEILLRPGERLGEPRTGLYNGNTARLYPILGVPGEEADPDVPQHLAESAMENAPATVVGRVAGTLEQSRETGLGDLITEGLGRGAALVVFGLGVVILAFVLAVRRRIDFANATVLAVVATVASIGAAVAPGLGHVFDWLGGAFAAGFDALFLFFLWATAESLLRDAGGEPVNALDLLRRGRIDRRVGRGAIYGLAAGAAIAALPLLAGTLPELGGAFANGFLPQRGTVLLPFFEAGRTPFDLGIRLAGETLLILALAYRLMPRPWVVPMTVAVAGLVRLVGTRDLVAWWADALVGLAVVGLVLAAYRRAGVLAALVAAVAGYLFPAAVFSAHYPAWLGGSLAAASLTLAALGVVGFVGLARGESEARPVEGAAFLARLDQERRMRYEMDLLARMQLGLLPREVPQLPGWQLAARSIVAHEVGGDFYDFLEDGSGRLWIAAGDVAGHGSFCSISHAMTKAALASLVAPERTPAEVLTEADRVLRTLDARRIFTSLALLRIEPGTGAGLFANAGYPFPLVRREVRSGDGGAETVREIELPGLPLGQGPARRYQDVPVELAVGEALVLASDGLFEAPTRKGEPYGFERYRAHLGQIDAGSADRILQTLLARWRETVGEHPIEDDTTVVVVRRGD